MVPTSFSCQPHEILLSPYYWDPIRHPYQTDAGIIIASIQNRDPEEIERIKNEALIDFTTVAKGEEACNKLMCLERAMRQIEQNEIGYMLLGPNSTSAAISVLRFCNLPWLSVLSELGKQRPGRYAPGLALYLLGELANTRAARKAVYVDLLEITDPCQNYYGY